MSRRSTRRGPLLRALPLRLTAYAVLPLAATLLVGGLLLLGALERSFERRLQQEVEMVARALRLPVSDALRDGSFDRLQRSLESAGAIGRVYGVSVYGQGGDLITSVGGASAASSREVNQILRDGERSGDYGNVAGREVYSYFVPLSGPGDRITGLLQVTRRKRDIRDFMKQLRFRGALLLGIGLLVMTSIVIVGHYAAVGRSLRFLESSIHRVESGEREHRAAVGGPREVAAVGRSLNSMLDSIDEAGRKVARERLSRELLEEKLRRSEKLAAIGRLAGGLAHELGAPLSLVDGHAQRALRDSSLSRDTRREIEITRREAERMSRLVRQLLDYGRAGRRRPTSVGASRLVTMTVTALAPEAEAEGVSIQTRGQPEDVRFVGDDTRLEQALLNVVRNAVQAARRQVEISWSKGPDTVTLAVEDDGSGVDPELHDRLFEPFLTTRAAEGGTGLGLAIAHSAVTEHGGALEFGRSELGGAVFTLTLPRDDGPSRRSAHRT